MAAGINYAYSIYLQSAYFDHDDGKDIPRLRRISVVNLFKLFYLIHHDFIYLDDSSVLPFQWKSTHDRGEISFVEFYALRYIIGKQDTYTHQMYQRAASHVAAEVEASGGLEDFPITGIGDAEGKPQIQKLIDTLWADPKDECTLTGNITIGGSEYAIQAEKRISMGVPQITVYMDNRQTAAAAYEQWGVSFRIERDRVDTPLECAAEASAEPIGSPRGNQTNAQGGAGELVTPMVQDFTPETKAMYPAMQQLKHNLEELAKTGRSALGFYFQLKDQKDQEALPKIDRIYVPVVKALHRYKRETMDHIVTSPLITSLAKKAKIRGGAAPVRRGIAPPEFDKHPWRFRLKF